MHEPGGHAVRTRARMNAGLQWSTWFPTTVRVIVVAHPLSCFGRWFRHALSRFWSLHVLVPQTILDFLTLEALTSFDITPTNSQLLHQQVYASGEKRSAR